MLFPFSIHPLQSVTWVDLRFFFFFLGLQVQYIGDVMHLSRSKYIQDLLDRTHLEDSKPTPTLGCSGWSISQTDGVPLHNPTKYRSIVRALHNPTLTRPNIAFVVNKACQFMD